MIETHLDQIAQESPFSHIHPGTKLLLAGGSLIFSLISPSFLVPLISGLCLSLTLLIYGKIHPVFYGKMLLLPAVFSIMSVLIIIFMRGGGEALASIPFLWMELTITTHSLAEGFQILCRVFGCTVSLYFIVLTTPLSDLLSSAKRLGVPVELTDLMMIIYRYIFIVYDMAVEIAQAQKMRLGYRRPIEAIQSFAMLSGVLFISSWNAGEGLIQAMDARCYQGEFPALEQPEPVCIASFLPVILYLIGLCTILVLTLDRSALHLLLWIL
ncbi:MAG: cobalt ECF transporter T component CbiQ [Methanomicrobiales archaeon]|jgi:cobalt/nickel transport system permease protein|nr:cobalt ECF transporter T component CbiQ [Methanomicrobiales archaeon]